MYIYMYIHVHVHVYIHVHVYVYVGTAYIAARIITLHVSMYVSPTHSS